VDVRIDKAGQHDAPVTVDYDPIAPQILANIEDLSSLDQHITRREIAYVGIHRQDNSSLQNHPSPLSAPGTGIRVF
jgi:hypothetical protein